MDTNTSLAPNPLLQPFNTLHDTAPFTKIKNEHYLPAFNEAVALARADMQAIIDNREVPDFANSIEAMERMGEKLGIIQGIFFNLNSAETNDEMQQIAQE
ncbi:MAG: M3 family peptidase, partial [Mangrovibacterium sp.]